MQIFSPAFENNTWIPSKYSCQGQNINPPLKIDSVPAEAKSLVLIVDDPDTPEGTWVHWLLWNIDPGQENIDEGSIPLGAQRGTNSFGNLDYGGPCPPSGTHRYYFKLYALDQEIDLPVGSKREDLDKMIEGHIVATAELVGLYTI